MAVTPFVIDQENTHPVVCKIWKWGAVIMSTADIVCAKLNTSCGFNDGNCGQPVNIAT